MVSPRVFWNIFLLYFFPFSFNLDRGYSTFAPPDASPHEYHLLSAFMAHKAFVCWYCHLLESFLSLSRIAPDSNKAIHNGQMAFSFSNHPWVKNEFRIHTAKNNNIRVKGQLISKHFFEAIVFPKKRTKYCKDFCPEC